MLKKNSKYNWLHHILRKPNLLFIATKKISVFCGSFLFIFAIFLTPPSILANPAGGQIVAGEATITTPNANTVQVNQTSNKAIINWQSFNIGSQERTHFQQPQGGVALNRINPQQGASQIFGQLSATGQIILVNPAGIYFGPGSSVNVGGLIASTADISNQNFMTGKYIFDGVSNYNGSIINAGTIIARDHGLVALVGNSVSNQGTIQANLGTVVLASGTKFTLDMAGDQLINFTVDEKITQTPVDHNDNPVSDGVHNSGSIIAHGGKVVMTAKAASNVLDHVINMTGIVEATSVTKQSNGEIILSGGNEGVVRVAGKLDASGKAIGQKGGKIHITGERILVKDSEIDVTGDQGAGEVLIGGDYLGSGTLQRAKKTVITSSSSIYADALTKGNGGKVIIWSDELTKFYGNIFARAGALSGDGGFVETSSKGDLEAIGNVNASALHGKSGQWLLDPANVTISNALTLNGLFSGGLLETFTTTANNAIANVATINAALDLGTSVTILTTPAGTQAGTITLSNPITKSVSSLSTPTLTLNAVSSITLNSNITSSAGALDVVLIGDSLAIGGTASSAINTNDGNFLATLQNGVTMSNAAGTITGTINAGSGTVTINTNADGTGASNFLMNANSSITTTNTSASAVTINVNEAGTGTGTATLRNITTGNGGTITVNTAKGGNTTGGSITMPSGTLSTGSGTVNLITSQTAARAVGTSGAPVVMTAANLNSTTGSGGLFVTNNGTSGLDLGTINSTGAFTLNSTSSTGITDSGTQTVTGVLTINAGTGQDITLNSAANNFGTAAIIGRNVLLTDTNALILGTSTIGTSGSPGSYNITTGGSITQSGILTINGTSTFTLTAGTTDLLIGTQANSFTNTPTITNNGNVRDLSFRNTDASALVPTLPTGMRNLTLQFDNTGMTLPATTLTGTLTATAAAAVSQSGAIAGTTLTAKTLNNAGADIILTDAGNAFTTINLQSRNAADSANAAGVISYTDADGFAVSLLRTTSNANLTSVGAMTDSGALTIGGTATLNAGAANITLNTATNDFNNVTISNTGSATLVDANTIDLGAITLTSGLTLTTTGAVTQSGLLTIPGTTTIAAGAANNITLDTLTNNFGTAAITTGNNVRLKDADAIILGTSTVSGAYDLTAGGNITQSGVLTITGTPTFTFTAGPSNLSLATQANNFATTPVITDNGNVQDVLLRNVNTGALVPTLPATLRALTLTFNANTNPLQLPDVTLTGNLSVTSNAAITQGLGSLIVNGASATATFIAGAANNITLNNAGNDFTTATITSGNNVQLRDANAIVLGTSTISGAFDLTAGGNITQTGVLSVTGTPTFTFTAGPSNLSLSGQANNFATTPVITDNGNVQDVLLRNVNTGALVPILPASLRALTLTFNANTSPMQLPGITLTSNLNVTSNAAITQTGGLIVNGAATTATFAAGAANNITLNNAANDFITTVITNGNNVQLRDANSLILGASTVSGTFDVTTNGAITQSGNQIITGLTTLDSNSNNITLATSTNNFSTIKVLSSNNVSLRDTNALILDSITANGTLTLQASGAGGGLTQAVGSAINATGTTTLIGGAANNITLANTGNNFSTVAITSGNNVSLLDTNAITLGTSTISGALDLTSGGSISQSGVLTVTGTPTFTLTVANNDVLLGTQANNFATTPVFSNNVFNLSLRNVNATAVVPELPTSLNDLTLIFNAAAMDLHGASSSALTLTGSLTATASGSITQSTDLSGTTLTAKTLNSTAGASPITLNTFSNDFTNVDLRTRNAGDTANVATPINYMDTSGFNINLIGTASTINLVAGAAIAQTGTITGSTLTAKTLNNLGADITLGNTGNSLTAINLTSRNAADTANAAGLLSYFDVSGLDIVNIGTTSTASITATALTQSGSITANSLIAKTLNNAGGAITFTNVSNNVNSIDLRARNSTDTANDTGVIDFTNANGFNVATIGTASTVSLIAGGSMTDSGNVTATTLTTNSVGGTILDFGHNVTGFNATNASSGNIQFDNTGTLGITGISLAGGGNFILNNTGALTITNTNLVGGGNANMNVTGTSTITGAINTTGNVDLISTGAVTDSTAGAITANTLAVTTLNNAGSAITLDNANLHNIITLNVKSRNAADTANAAGAIVYRDLDGFDVAAANTTSTVTLTALDALTQSGSMAGSTLTATTLNNAGSSITFNNSSNLFANINLQSRNAANSADSNGQISYSNAGNINITALRTLADADISANGTINDSGNVIVNTLTTSSVGGIALNSAGNVINNLDVANNGGAITFVNTAEPLTILGFNQIGSGAVSITNVGTLVVTDGVSIASGNAAITLVATDLNLNATGSINSGTSNTSITQNTASSTIGLGNASGTMTLSGSELERITANNFSVIAPSNGQIIVDGVTAANMTNVSNLTTLTATNGTLGSINFENNASTFKALSASADNGITVGNNAGITTTVGSLFLDSDAGGGTAGSDVLTLNANLTSAGAMTLNGGVIQGIVLGNSINLIGNGVTISDPLTGAFNLSVDSGAGTARFDDPISIANLIVGGSIIAINGGGGITTTGDQTYNGFIDFGTDTTLTASNITFNDDVTGNQDLTIIGQSGNNMFAFNGGLGMANISITGSSNGNNILQLNSGNFAIWNITGNNAGNIDVTGISGNFGFTRMQNLNAGDNGNSFVFANGASVSGMIDGGNLSQSNTLNYQAYSTPINAVLADILFTGLVKNNTDSTITNFININNIVGNGESTLTLPAKTSYLALTGATDGYIDDPLFYNQFKFITTTNGNDIVDFITPGVYNTATNALTINGTVVHLEGFNPNNFIGNITFTNVIPVPPAPIPPVGPIVSIASILSPYDKAPFVTNIAAADVSITNEVGSGVNANGVTIGTSEYSNGTSNGSIVSTLLLQAINAKLGIKNQWENTIIQTMTTVRNRSIPFASVNLTKMIIATFGPREVLLILLTLGLMGAIIQKSRRERAMQIAQLREFIIHVQNSVPILSFKVRTALTNVIGFADIIYNGQVGKISIKQKELLNHIISEAQDVLEAISKLETENNTAPLDNIDQATLLSFQLRTALNSIIGFTDLIYYGEVGKITDTQKIYLQDMLTSSNQILALVPAK